MKVGGRRTSTTATSGRSSTSRVGELRAVLQRGDDLEAVGVEHAREPVAQQAEVLGDYDAHGSSAVTTVPEPTGLDTVNTPSKGASRRINPRRPEPAAGSAPPRPSSATRSTRRSARSSTLTSICDAPLWRIALVTSSTALKYSADSSGAGNGRASRTRD